MQRAIAQQPRLEALCLGLDGKVGVPSGWQKKEGGGFVREEARSGVGEQLASIKEVLEFELQQLANPAQST